MNQEPFGGRLGGRSVVRSFDCIFNIYFYLCSLFIRFFIFFSCLLLILFLYFPLFTPSDSFSNQAVLAELFVMQKSAGRRAVCSSMRGGLFRDFYINILYPSNGGNSLVFWWIAGPGRDDFSTSGLSTFKKIALISAPDYKNWFRVIKD